MREGTEPEGLFRFIPRLTSHNGQHTAQPPIASGTPLLRAEKRDKVRARTASWQVSAQSVPRICTPLGCSLTAPKSPPAGFSISASPKLLGTNTYLLLALSTGDTHLQ